MTDLFSGQEAPLADRMRPRTLAEFIGQRHLLGEGRLLRRAIEADRLTSSIFFGPPGCGKTTLASIIANSTKSAFVQLNAVTSGVADVRKVIADAQERRAGITARDSRDMAQRIVIGDDMHLPIAALRVVDGAAHGGQHVPFRQRLELEYAAAADDSGRHGHHRVFRRRADKADDTPLDGGQDAVTLRL